MTGSVKESTELFQQQDRDGSLPLVGPAEPWQSDAHLSCLRMRAHFWGSWVDPPGDITWSRLGKGRLRSILLSREVLCGRGTGIEL